MHKSKGWKRQAQIKLYCSNWTEVLHLGLSLSCYSLGWRQPDGSPACCCLLDNEWSWATSSSRSRPDQTGATTCRWLEQSRSKEPHRASGISKRVTSTCQIKTFLPCEECSEKALSHLSWFHPFLKCSLLLTNELKVRRHLLLSVCLWTRTEKESGGVKTVSQSL